MRFTQSELEAAYVQMQQERAEDNAFADKAAKKLEALVRGSKATCSWVEGNSGMQFAARPWMPTWAWANSVPVQPQPCEYEIRTLLCDYDNWEEAHKDLSKHCKLEPYNSKMEIKGVFDLSGDPDFAHARIKTYHVKVEYYDSHAGGY